ncbi:hypothetical protein [uncultured Amaricoccus sp.]|uniref:hypothetical protein n=2 Tax=Amaricoccus TaxID=56999 RepID=UPI002613110C|nr:hypothetical protein [uncultured Amaricoccus sp.]
MKTGVAISAAAHGALIALVVLGVPWLSRRDSPAVPVTDVSFISEADFDRAQAAAEAERREDAPAEQPVAAAPPRERPAEAPPETPPEANPEPEPTPEPAPAPELDQSVATLAPSFNPETPLAAPEAQPPIAPTPSAPDRLAAVAPPRSRPAVPTRPAPIAQPEPEPEPEPEPTAIPEPAATPKPVEAPEPATLALDASSPPMARPKNLPDQTRQASDVLRALRQEVEREQARRQEAKPERTAERATPPTEPTVTRPTPPSDGRAQATSLAEGSPITNAEKEGLRLAVQRCWVVPAGVRDAGELRVVLAARLEPDGSVISGSIRLIEPSPAPDARFQAAYDAGRRALLRCAPYSDLPREKYARWRDIEVVFDPKGMVSW